MFKLWRDKAGPCMQILHFCFAFGAFVAPLISKQFVSEQDEMDVMSDNDSIPFPCEHILNQTISFDEKVNLMMLDEINVDNISVCFNHVHDVCENLTTNILATLTDNCTLIYEDNEGIPNFALAYWIASSFFLPSLFAFIYFALTKDFNKKCCKQFKKIEVSNESEISMKENKKTSSTQPIWFLIVMFTLLFIFFFLYVGLEVAYGSLIFTVAVKGDLGFSKSDASILTALFWGTFAFTRLFSVLLAVLKIRTSVMMIGNLSGSLLASLILVFYPHDAIAIWIGSGVLGASFASIYPTTMTWMSENTVASAKASSILVAAGTLGDISIPSIIALIVAKFSKDLLLYITFGGVVISSIVVAILFLVTCLYNQQTKKDKRKSSMKLVKYNKLNEETENCENLDIDSEKLHEEDNNM